MKGGPLADHWGEIPNQLPQIIKMGTRDEVQWALMIAGSIKQIIKLRTQNGREWVPRGPRGGLFHQVDHKDENAECAAKGCNGSTRFTW